MVRRIPFQPVEHDRNSANKCTELAETALGVLAKLLDDPSQSPQVQIAAARVVLDATSRFRDLKLHNEGLAAEFPTLRGVH